MSHIDLAKGTASRTPAVPFSPFSRVVLARAASTGLVVGLPVLVLVLFVIYPLAAIILQSVFPNLFAVQPNLVPNLSSIGQVFGNPANYHALINSLTISGLTAVIAAALGTIMAVLIKRTDLPFRGLMETLVWMVFFFPSFLLGEAWLLVVLRGGIPDQFLHFSDAFINWFFSPVGVVFILSLKTFPFVYISVSSGLRWLGSEFEDAARLAGAQLWRAWLRINVPLLLPAIFAGG
ncbi:MAG TPA: ABC transporter permease subunit, partial [Anaerolineales bacterium]